MRIYRLWYMRKKWGSRKKYEDEYYLHGKKANAERAKKPRDDEGSWLILTIEVNEETE